MKLVAVIYLHVIGPLKQPTLLIKETIHGNQSYVVLECRVQGPEIISITFLKDGVEMPKSVSRMDHTRTLDACDPGSSGIYTCRVRNPLDNKTSPEVRVTQDKYDCKYKTEHVENGSTGLTITITAIAIIGIIAAICIGFLVYRCQKADGKKLRRGCKDMESGNTSQETSLLDISPIKENPSGEEQRKGSYQQVPMIDLPESKEEVKVEMDPMLSTEEDSPPCLLPGHHGQDEKPTMELEEDGTTLDHGQEANG